MKAFEVLEGPFRGIRADFDRTKETNYLYGIPIDPRVTNHLRKKQLREPADLELVHKKRPRTIRVGRELVRLCWFDLAGDRIVPEADIQDRRAVVLVQTAPGLGGELHLFGNTVVERLDGLGQVWRDPAPFPPVGVRTAFEFEEDYGVRSHLWCKRWLVIMQPGASFRIRRSGQLNGAPPELVVTWTGWWSPTALTKEGRRDVTQWGLKVHHPPPRRVA